MKKVNVYTCYDQNKTIIGKIIPQNGKITKATYNRLLRNRTIGGDAGIYTDSEEDIMVVDKDGNHLFYLTSKPGAFK